MLGRSGRERRRIGGTPPPGSLKEPAQELRRLTLLTNAFSKKLDDLWAAYCPRFACCNSCRIHKSLRVTPVMEAGLTNRVSEIADLLDDTY